MRICFLSFSVYGYFDQTVYGEAAGGGAQRQLYLLAQELADDHDVHFVVGDYGQDQTEVREGVTLHRAFRPVGSTSKKPLEIVQLFAAMRRADADVYVSRNKPSVALVSYLCARFLRRHWVFNVANDRFVHQDLNYLSWSLRRGYEHALRRADEIIAQTPHQQTNLRDIFGVDSAVVPNGYTTREETPGFEDRDLFLWVGHLDPEQKRPRLFLNLAERVPEAEFLLVGARGSDELRESLRAELDEMDNADYAFDVAPSEVHQYYERALALINTSAYEGFPNTYLEAWRTGTPVLALSVDPGQFIQQGDAGAFLSDNPSALAESVKTIQSDPEYWQKVSETSRRTFEQEFAIEKVADSYAEALEAAVS